MSALEEELACRLRGLSCVVPRQWLRDFVSQQPLATGDDVYDALLNSDLARVGLFSLPNNIYPIKARGVLRGCILVQLVSIIDVGASAYTQLAHLKGTLNANNEVSAEDTPNAGRETSVRGRRCLSLEVSDGRTKIRAIEFEPVDCLSVECPRGSKLLIRGPLEVRRAIILLRAGSVELLGGSCPLDRDNGDEVGQPMQSRTDSQQSQAERHQLELRERELQEALQRQRVRRDVDVAPHDDR